MSALKETVLIVRSGDGGPVGLLLTCDYTKENDAWLGECSELGTATFASTLEGARKELGEAILLHLNQVREMGFESDFLATHNVQLIPLTLPPSQSSKALWVKPEPLSA